MRKRLIILGTIGSLVAVCLDQACSLVVALTKENELLEAKNDVLSYLADALFDEETDTVEYETELKSRMNRLDRLRGDG